MSCWCNGQCPNIGPAAALADKKRFGQAEVELRRVLTRAPNCPQANLMLANALTSTNRAAFAVPHLLRAVAAEGETPDIALRVAVNLRHQAKIVECVQAFKLAVDAAPSNPHAWAGLIGAHEAAGELDEAMAAIERVQSAFWTPELRRVAALVFAARKDYAGAVKLLSVDDAKPIEILDRGRYREKLGDYAGAWSDWMGAKATLRERAGHHYNARRVERQCSAIIETTQPARARFIHSAEPMNTWPRPIFVTGFPRSGTTMVEAALGSHSQIMAGDELMGLPEVMRLLPRLLRAGVPYPAALLATSQGENTVIPNLLRDFYYSKARERIGFVHWSGEPADIPLERFFTDKMPLNELHLPLIYCLFPAAPVFHVRRHPLDVIVSNMSHFLTHGGFFASSPEAAAHHLALVDQVTEHHKRHLTDGRIFQTVRYESFVADHRGAINTMFDALAPLAIEPACYDFHLSAWHSRTISYRQIKEPVSDKSVGRYKNFLDQLAPIIDTVRPIIEREGYEL